MAKLYDSITELVGETPLVHLHRYGDAVKASLEKGLAQQDASMQSVANSLTTYIDQDPIKVRVEYVDADGTTLCEKEYTSGN